MDAIGFYNQLRKAGVGLNTCCEGAIDLGDFAKQLLLFVNQKANNDYLRELSPPPASGYAVSLSKVTWNCGNKAYFPFMG